MLQDFKEALWFAWVGYVGYPDLRSFDFSVHTCSWPQAVDSPFKNSLRYRRLRDASFEDRNTETTELYICRRDQSMMMLQILLSRDFKYSESSSLC